MSRPRWAVPGLGARSSPRAPTPAATTARPIAISSRRPTSASAALTFTGVSETSCLIAFVSRVADELLDARCVTGRHVVANHVEKARGLDKLAADGRT